MGSERFEKWQKMKWKMRICKEKIEEHLDKVQASLVQGESHLARKVKLVEIMARESQKLKHMERFWMLERARNSSLIIIPSTRKYSMHKKIGLELREPLSFLIATHQSSPSL
jgi:hypothetical protein